MNETNTVLSYQNIIDYFLEHGCSTGEALAMIKVCPDLLNMDKESLDKKVSLLFNSDVFYGIIICNQNNWKEYLCSQTNKDDLTDSNGSYVAQSFIETVEKQYIQKILQIQPTDTLEDKLYKMKKASFNSSGYKVK